MPDWRQIQNAVRDAVVTASGLTHVNWADQNGPQPTRPFATLKVISGPTKFGAFDEQMDVTNLANPAGQEIEQTIKGQREFVVSCQVFTDANADAGTAYDYLSRLMISMELPSLRTMLRNVGLALISHGAIQDISALLETKWQSRAQMDVRFRYVDSAVEKTGYIEKVGPTSPTWS